MSGFRLSIAGMVGLVAVVALALVSLRYPSVGWLMLGSSATLGVLLTGVLGALYGRGADRAFWVGFALFGTTYLILVNWDWIGGQFGYDLTRGLDDFAESLVEPLPASPTGTAAAGFQPSVAQSDRSVKVGNILQLSRMFLSLVFALGGGLIGRAIALRSSSSPIATPNAGRQ